MSYRKPFRAKPIRRGAHYRRKSRQRQQFGFVRSYGLIGLASFTAFAAVLFWPAGKVSQATTAMSGGFTCQVSSITDGDTLRCANGTRIRLHAVAARESDETCRPGHPCPDASGASATAKLSELASGQTLTCQQTGTSYERVTAICRNEARVEINCAMVKSGTAVIWPRFNAERPICQA